MAFRTWGRLLLTALGVSVLAGAGQLGVAYGFGIVRLTGAFTGTTVNQWPAQLVWVGWFAANAAVAGAVLTGRLARRDAVRASTGRQLAIGAAAAFGATVVAPLCMQPARAAELISVDPVWAVGICAVLGAVIGAGAAIAVLLRPELGWNMAAVAGAVWVLALVSVLPSLGTTGPLPTVRLGVLEPSWLDDDAAQRLALVLLPLTALLAGAATAGLARWRGQVPLVSGATGVAGPVLVAFAYLTAGPGDAVDRYQTTPYYGALIAILAGALGAAAAALLRWPVRARTANPLAIEPTNILRPLPAGPALPGKDPANPADDRDAAEPAGADLAGTSAGRDLRVADGTGAVRTVPPHWDWPAASGTGQHGSVPADPNGTRVPRPAGRPRHHIDDPGHPATTAAPVAPSTTGPSEGEPSTAKPGTGGPSTAKPGTGGPSAAKPGAGGPSSGGPAQDGPAGADQRETGSTEATRPARGARTSAADVAALAEPTRAATTDVTGPSASSRAGRTVVDPAVPTDGPGGDGSTSTAATSTTGTALPIDERPANNGPTDDGTTSASTETATASAARARASTTSTTSASTASASTGSASTASASTASKSAGTARTGTAGGETTSESADAAGNGAADAPAPKPRRTRKPKSAPAATTSDVADGTTPSDPEAAADPARSTTAGRARKATRPAKATDGTGSGTDTDGPRPGTDAPGTEPGRGARAPEATPAATTAPAARSAAIDPTASPATADPAARSAAADPAARSAAADPAARSAATTGPAAAEPAADSAAAVAPRTDQATDTERSANAGGSAGPLFGVAAAAGPEPDRWTPAAPAWPVTPAWTAPAQAGAPEPAASDGPEEPAERMPRPRHRAPLPDLSRASTWDAFTTAPREGAADPLSTGATSRAPTGSPSDPAPPSGSSSPTGPATPAGPRSASDRAASRWRRAARTPDVAAEAAPSDPAGQAAPTSAPPPEQTGVGAEAGGPASADARPATPATGNDAEQSSRRGRLGGLFRRNRSRADEEILPVPDATEPLPAQDEEFVDWVAGLSKPVADNEPEQENGRRSLRSTGRHHRD